MDDYHFLDSFKNKRLQITLNTAKYVGTVQRINLNKTVILEDVVDVESGIKWQGVKLFFGHEILKVEIPSGLKRDSDPVTGGQLTVAEFQPYRKTVKLGDNDNDDGEFVDYLVIDEFYEKFGPAVMHIRKQQVVGIGADGFGVFQHERLYWLQIATKDKVYLFDILLLGPRGFKNGLSSILENKQILKVAHDCRGLAACLRDQYGVSLANVFDTQVADAMHFYSETGGFLPDRVSTLQEVVGLHLKMGPSRLATLNIKARLTEENREAWYVRPCPTFLLKLMALSVIHLLPLRLVLLDALLADYTCLVDHYLKLGRAGIGTVGELDLPQELRKLEDMVQERRGRATRSYAMTDDGLLVRSSPHTVVGQTATVTGMTEMAGMTEMTEMTGMTEMTEMTGMAGMTEMTGMAEMPGMTGMTEMAGMTVGAERPRNVTREGCYHPPTPGALSGVAHRASATKVGAGQPENTPGRGRHLQPEALPTPASFPSIGRGLSFPSPRETSGASMPREGGKIREPGRPAATPAEGVVSLGRGLWPLLHPPHSVTRLNKMTS